MPRFPVYFFLFLVFARCRSEMASITGFSPTGNDLVKSCGDAATGGENAGACFGYLHGVLNGFVVGGIYNAPLKAHGSKFIKGSPCVPDGVTNLQLLKVTLGYAEKHPEELHFPASNLVIRAVTSAWGSAPTCY